MKIATLGASLLSLAGLMLPAMSAVAAEFNQVHAAKSQITFTYSQMGVTMNGRIGKSSARFRFDPARANAASADIAVDLAGVDVGSAEAHDAVADKDWFNTKAFPTARFVTTGIRALGGNRYEAIGTLSIKGRSREIAIPFTFSQSGAAGAFDGVFTLKRLDYAIGEGAWADTQIVGNDIQIKFHILAGSAPARP